MNRYCIKYSSKDHCIKFVWVDAHDEAGAEDIFSKKYWDLIDILDISKA